MNAIIFGANGQDGVYLTDLLERNNVSVVGITRRDDDKNSGISHWTWVKDLIYKHSPTYIFHLAANSTTLHSSMFENHLTISTGALNILESVRLYSPASKVFISGSGLQFRNFNKPIDEFAPFEARDAYSMSRIHSVYTSRYFRSLGVKCYVGYFFNHESPLRTERHVSKMIANKVKMIRSGGSEKIEIGDLSVIKEWTCAQDIVEALWLFVQQDDIFEAVLGSGEGFSIQQYIEQCFLHINKDWQAYVSTKKDYTPAYRSLISDPHTIFSLGWRPKLTFNDLVNAMLND